MAELLALKDRTKAAATAKANTVYILFRLITLERFELPKSAMGPLFLADNPF